MIKARLYFSNSDYKDKHTFFPVLPSKGDVIWCDQLFNGEEYDGEGWVVSLIDWEIPYNAEAMQPTIVLCREME